jgi:hypothetical protein
MKMKCMMFLCLELGYCKLMHMWNWLHECRVSSLLTATCVGVTFQHLLEVQALL